MLFLGISKATPRSQQLVIYRPAFNARLVCPGGREGEKEEEEEEGNNGGVGGMGDMSRTANVRSPRLTRQRSSSFRTSLSTPCLRKRFNLRMPEPGASQATVAVAATAHHVMPTTSRDGTVSAVGTSMMAHDACRGETSSSGGAWLQTFTLTQFFKRLKVDRPSVAEHASQLLICMRSYRGTGATSGSANKTKCDVMSE